MIKHGQGEKTRETPDDSTQTQTEELNLITVHCFFKVIITSVIRIWKTTFLVDHVTGERAKLLKAIDIPYAPDSRLVQTGTTARFTLIFDALPKSCTSFNMIEETSEPFPFNVFDISRNASDIYYVHITNPFDNPDHREN